MPSAISLEKHAAETLRYIRASMDGAGSLAVPGSAGITMGLVGFVAAALAPSAGSRTLWLSSWLIAAAVASACGGLLMARQAALQGFTLFGAPVRKLVLCLAPGLFAGASMTFVLWQSNNLHAIPAVWLLLYGCALISSSAPTTRLVGILGALFTLLGLITFWLPDHLHNMALGLGFGGLHLGFGILIGQRSRAGQK